MVLYLSNGKECYITLQKHSDGVYEVVFSPTSEPNFDLSGMVNTSVSWDVDCHRNYNILVAARTLLEEISVQSIGADVVTFSPFWVYNLPIKYQRARSFICYAEQVFDCTLEAILDDIESVLSQYD